MDWYSWLSKTGLDPLLTYEYGLMFTTNHLQQHDITYFNHEFLQSLGISVAKHRLQILKLCSKDVDVKRDSTKSSIALAISKTKSLLCRWTSRRRIMHLWSWRSKMNDKVVNNDNNSTYNYNYDTRIMRSGPIERAKEHTFVTTSISGPLDRKMHEKLMSTSWNNLSPPLCGPQYLTHTQSWKKKALEEYGDGVTYCGLSHYKNNQTISHVDEHDLGSVWSSMFQDIKPT